MSAEEVRVLKLSRPIVSIDLETTGLDVMNDKIVDIGMVKLHPLGAQESRTVRVNPGIPISAQATAVNEITDADVQDKPRFEDVAADLLEFLKGCDVTGYNVLAYDMQMLTSEFYRCGIEWPSKDVVVVDAIEIFRRQEPHSLAKALRLYANKDLGKNAHNALADAAAALDTLLGQSRFYGKDTLVELIELGRDKDWVDRSGKLKWVGDTVVMTFGKWEGKSLKQVEKSYLKWILEKGFPQDFTEICRAALNGEYPTRK